MAEFLTTHGTAHYIETIIMDANNQLTLVSPYLQLSKTLFERLKDAADRGVKIKTIYGKDELKTEARKSLTELKNTELFFFQNLHAKCYFNENKMVITSMNMYEFSEKNNREMGILIDSVFDKDIFTKATRETQSIMQSARQEHLGEAPRSNYYSNDDQGRQSKYYSGSDEGKQSKYYSSDNNEKPGKYFSNKNDNNKLTKYYPSVVGYCIRCNAYTGYHPDSPYCYKCFSKWAQFGNPNYQENVCHCCGERGATSMSKPECYKCYNSK